MNKIFRVEANMLLHNNTHYLLSDLEEVHGISENMADRLRSYIMKHYFVGKLYYDLVVALPEESARNNGYTQSSFPISSRELFTEMCRSAEQFIGEDKGCMSCENITLEELKVKEWYFYHNLTNKVYTDRKAVHIDVELYISYLAIHILDLVNILKKLNVGPLVALLPENKISDAEKSFSRFSDLVIKRYNALYSSANSVSDMAKIIYDEIQLSSEAELFKDIFSPVALIVGCKLSEDGIRNIIDDYIAHNEWLKKTQVLPPISISKKNACTEMTCNQ